MARAAAAVVTDAANDVDAAEIACVASRAHLAEVLAFVDDACVRAGLDREVAFDLRLAAEEVVMNVIVHGYGAGPAGPLTVRFRREPERVVLVVEDLAQPFDPALVPRADPTAPLEERRIGGLGWHLVNQVMDEVHHERLTPAGNRLTLVKRLLPTH
jgi:serine/threonine-protein kinase RsbW